MEVVEVEWIDAQSCMDAITLDELKKESVITTKSCGYLVHGDDEKIILAFMVFGDELLKHYQIIPRKMIKKIKSFNHG